MVKLKPIPLLTTRNKTAHISSRLQSGGVISIGQMYGGGGTEKLTTTNMTVKNQVQLVLESHQKCVTGICTVNLTKNLYPNPTPT